jgi:TolB-like protein
MKNIAEPVRAFAIQARADRVAAPGAMSGVLRNVGSRRTPIAITALVAVIVAGGVFIASSRKATTTAAPPPASAPVALALPSRPSIAVLPFENIGGDPEQAYFADGLTEDLITDLSKVSGLFVIARNSTFVYKGKATDVRDVARALGVRYVLEGSVRRSGNDVRVNAQLIDGATGGHLWATRQDGDWKRIFSLQDAVARNVVDALAVELTKDDKQRVAHRETANADAYDEFLKGWQLYLRQTPADFVAAIVHFKAAVELDPSYGRAYAALAAIHWEAYTRYWGRAMGARTGHEPRVRAEEFLARAMKNPTPLAYQVSSAMLLQTKQYDEAAAEAQRGIESDPNDPDGYLAMAEVLSFTGKAGEALELVRRAMRLNPHYPPHYLYQLGLAQFGLGHLDEARVSLEQAIAGNPGDHWSERLLLATYGLLGQRAAGTRLLETMSSKDQRGSSAAVDPITVRALTFWHPFAVPSDAKRFVDGLRKAGVPD